MANDNLIKPKYVFMNHRKKTLALATLFICFHCHLISQTVDHSVIQKYNASVVAKLFGIVKYVELEPELQLRLAYSIHGHDSTIASWIAKGKSKASVDTLQQVAQFQLYGMLSKDQLQTYKYNSTLQISGAIAKGEAEYIREEYKPDNNTFEDIKKSLVNKYNYLLQSFSDNYLMNNEGSIDYVKKLGGIYDWYKYFPIFYSKKYIDDYSEKIRKIKSIPDSTLANIQHSFYNLVWQNKYNDWSLAAQNATRRHLPDTSIFSSLHRLEIEQEVAEASAIEKYNYIFRDHASEDAFKDLEKLIKEKHYKRAVLQRTYALYHPQYFKDQLRETTHHYDSVIKANLILDGSLLPTTQFAIALKFKKDLKLRPSLCDTLLQHAMYLEKQRDSILFIDPFATIDFGEYETKYLTQLLTEKEYTTVLFQKNRTYAAANAQTDWQEMVVRGLDRGFLKEEAIRQMTEFYVVKNEAWCRYANDKIRLWANLYALDQIKPKALKVLDPIRWSGSTEKSTNNLQLQW